VQLTARKRRIVRSAYVDISCISVTVVSERRKERERERERERG